MKYCLTKLLESLVAYYTQHHRDARIQSALDSRSLLLLGVQRPAKTKKGVIKHGVIKHFRNEIAGVNNRCPAGYLKITFSVFLS